MNARIAADLTAARRALARPRSRFRDVGGVGIHWIDEGPPDAALAVVLLPGQWLSALSMDRWAAVLSSRYRVIRLDLPGHGLCGPFPDEDHSPAAYAALLDEVMRVLDPPAYVVVGCSFSGIAAAIHAAGRPRGLRGVVLATSSGLPRPPGGSQPNVAPPDPSWAGEGKGRPRAFYEWKLGTLLRRPMRTEDRDALIDEVCLLNELAGREMEARLRVRDHDPSALTAALPSIAAPVLVQWSSDSTYLPPAMAATVAALAPHPWGVLHYPETGHLLLVDAPEDTARDMLPFLAEIAA